jgi:hypothetical protein
MKEQIQQAQGNRFNSVERKKEANDGWKKTPRQELINK